MPVRDRLQAADLDRAVVSWGEFVTGKIEEREWDYRNDCYENKKDIDPDRVRDVREEAFYYWVRAEVRRFGYYVSGTGPGGVPTAGGRYARVKPATFDPIIDSDLRTSDTKRIDAPPGR